MDALAALKLQIEWGADEALAEASVDRLALPGPVMPRPVMPRPVVPIPGLTGPALTGLAPQTASSGPKPAASRRPPVAPAARPLATPPVARAQSVADAARTVEDLRAALAGFDGCGLATTATNLVFADGNPDAGLMFVGEGPGAEEDRAGRPFVGPSGQFLDAMLASIGLDRGKYLITNLIPWRPPGNRNPTESEVLTCLPFLLRHIALVRPRRLVLLGALAARAVTGSSAGIRRMRGSWVDCAIPGLPDPVPALPMLHPAYLLRTPGAKRDAWADLRLLRRSLDGETGPG